MMDSKPGGSRLTVLVSAASKYDSTSEIAEHIGAALGRRGLGVTVAAPDEVNTVDDYDAVVLGSAVYAGQWRTDAKDLVERIAAGNPSPIVWMFSSGPVGDPPKPEQDLEDVGAIIEVLSPRDHRVFAGKVDKARLSFGERAMMTVLRAPAGDFRDWEEIADWAEGIADSMEAELPS